MFRSAGVKCPDGRHVRAQIKTSVPFVLYLPFLAACPIEKPPSLNLVMSGFPEASAIQKPPAANLVMSGSYRSTRDPEAPIAANLV